MNTKAGMLPGSESGVISTGVEGLDNILGGGLTPYRLYLIEGTPGVGKTTLALQFRLAGARNGERVLYVSLSESEAELRAVAATHGWNMYGVHIRELIPSEESLRPDQQYTLFHPSEVELGETTMRILEEAERVRPTGVLTGVPVFEGGPDSLLSES
jgi:circadian clock protein KaiC